MHDSNFAAQRVSRTANITLNGDPDTIFPLFGAFEERKWAEGWNPDLIYPATEIIEEGTTFKTSGHGHDEEEFLWIVIKYDPQFCLIRYLVSTPNRYWTITVECKPAGAYQSSAKITYCYTGLNEHGNILNQQALKKMYLRDLKDWEEEINYYLEDNIR